MRDVAFYYRRKTGLAKVSDSGLADVLLGGEGLNVSLLVLILFQSSHGSFTGCDPSRIFETQSLLGFQSA